MRILIAGGPRTGKTIFAEKLAKEYGLVPISTDETLNMGWSEASEEVSHWFNSPAFIIEGVTVPRALRKWLRVHLRTDPETPADVIYFSNAPFLPRSIGQETMAKGVMTVWREILPELRYRKIPIKAW